MLDSNKCESDTGIVLIRPRLEYHPDGHPVLSKEELHQYGDALVGKYWPERLRKPDAITSKDMGPGREAVPERDGLPEGDGCG